MRLLVLMAGGSDAFEVAGHAYPKNLVEIDGQPLVQRVIENLRPVIEGSSQSIYLVRESEDRQHHTADVIRLLVPDAEVALVPDLESGAACTALHAISHLGRDEPLAIVNGDQVLDVNLRGILERFEREGLDGGVVTFDAVHPRWSYVRVDDAGFVVEAAEKRPISRLATAGVYWFRRGGDFVDGAMAMIRKDAAVDGRFYICPVYNELVLRQMKIGTAHVDRISYTSLSSPRNVAQYEELLSRAGDWRRAA
jgi:dTDP-glucose pyrophosphorylase